MNRNSYMKINAILFLSEEVSEVEVDREARLVYLE